jgi:hypothetical protein
MDSTSDELRALEGTELDTVAGGTSNSDWSSWISPLLPPIPYPGGNSGPNKGA